jgi:putative ABC transport system substrate-binding protein
MRLSRRRTLAKVAGLGISVAGLVILDGCGLRLPSAASGAKIARVGYLGDPPDSPWVIALWDGLHERGWVEGENLIVERRHAESSSELPGLAVELMALPVDVFVTTGTDATIHAKRASNTIPIVFASLADPVGVGVVASLARPGGNVTGVSNGASTPVNGKKLELLEALVPGLEHVAYLIDPGNPVAGALGLVGYQEAAGALGLGVQALYVGSADDLATTFATAHAWTAVIVQSGPFTVTERIRIAELAARGGVPAMYGITDFVYAGGLMSYGTNNTSTHRHSAAFVDKILRGAKPADLPVEQLTSLEFAVNVRALQELGLTLPPDMAAQVTEWVQ